MPDINSILGYPSFDETNNEVKEFATNKSITTSDTQFDEQQTRLIRDSVEEGLDETAIADRLKEFEEFRSNDSHVNSYDNIQAVGQYNVDTKNVMDTIDENDFFHKKADLGIVDKATHGLQEIGKMIKIDYETGKFEHESDDYKITTEAKDLANLAMDSGKFIVNMYGDALQLIGEVGEVVTHAPTTLGTIGDLSVGLVEHGITKVADKVFDKQLTPSEEMELVSQVGANLKKEYGSSEKIKKAMVENPVDVLLTFMGGIGIAKKVATAKKATDFANKLEKIESVINPLNIQKAIVPEIVTTASQASKKLKTFISNAKPIDDVIGEIIQGKTKDIEPAKRALNEIDLDGIKDYNDLNTRFDSRKDDIISKQDQILEKDNTVYQMDDLKVYSKGGTESTNFVEKGLDQLEELYKKLDDIDNLEEIKALKQKGMDEGFTVKEVNDLARKYASEFRKKAFDKMGNQKFTDIGQAFETTRVGIKNIARDILPDNATRLLDESYSNIANTQANIDVLVEKINSAKQKIVPRGALGNLIHGAFDIADKVTGGLLRGVRNELTGSGKGKKILQPIEIQERLAKNLERIDRDSVILNKVVKKQDFTRKEIIEGKRMMEDWILDSDGSNYQELFESIQEMPFSKGIQNELIKKLDDHLENVNKLKKEMDSGINDFSLVDVYEPDLVKAFNKLQGIQKRTKTTKVGDKMTSVEFQTTPAYKKFSELAQEYITTTGTDKTVQELFEDMSDMVGEGVSTKVTTSGKSFDKKKKNIIMGEELDFKKPGSFSKFRKKDANYMIASAENPMGEQATSVMNIKTNKDFGDFLKENGVEAKQQLGKYGQEENSYIMKIDTPEQRKLIDEWLATNSPQAENIIIKDGKAVRYDPRTNEAYEVDLKDKDLAIGEDAKDFYSEIDGKKYQLPLYSEFEKPFEGDFKLFYNK